MSEEERAEVGEPVGDEVVAGEALRWQDFRNARFYWTPDTGVTVVRGLIHQRFLELGGHDEAGVPITDELGTPDGRGRYNHFTGTGGASVYWTPQTDAHEVYGGIRARWAQLGWERSYLGYPVSGEHDVEPGRASDFENGVIEWHRDTGEVVDRPNQ